ncbi:DUF1552 domain-containing protein [Lentisphaera marina]|uniref:DUF1552 domain-containing protein n=1 Tax=Lentisphaera marina TaxID=1111041 RepID=UPI002366B7FF|nr:DUF1552 domain-containing protein [Lentisphaera marina]MDD7984765.1 DUF1552 domain-containing protein [Lentisphaera marina]
MYVKKFMPLDRRTFLRGAGGALMSLPMMEAMGDTAKDSMKSPKRMVCGAIFYGFMPKYFNPVDSGSNYTLPALLKPLAKHKNDFTVFGGLDHNMGGGHQSTRYFLNGIQISEAAAYKEGNISLDQKAAQFVGAQTRYPSLVLGATSNAFNMISWSSNSIAKVQVSKVSHLYSLLFQDMGARQKTKFEKRLKDKSSILDLVCHDAKKHESKFSKKDKEKLDQYFTSIRELEKRAEQSRQWMHKSKPKTDYVLDRDIDQLDLAQRMNFYYDLMVLALQTDSTRVISLSFSALGSNYGGFEGVAHDYHTLSHHGNVQETMDELLIIEKAYMQGFAYFLDKLKEVKEPSGQTLFDSTMSLFGSGMSSGNSHSNRNLPVVLAGGGFKHGEHKHYARQSGGASVELCNLYLSMLQNFGLDIDSFNRSTGPLQGLETV